MKRSIWIHFIAFLLGLSTFAKASLWYRGGGLIYDDVFNVTWTQDMLQAPIKMHQDDAMVWAANIEYYDSVRDVIRNDRSLTTALDRNGILFFM